MSTTAVNKVSVDSWNYLAGKDVINGREGAVYAIIEDENIQVAEVKTLKATVTKNKTELKTLGMRAKQYKATGWEGKGQMTLYHISSRWAEIMADYATSGKDTYFTIQVQNADPTSATGSQTINLYNVNLDEADIAVIDVDADSLEQSVNFTFDNFDIAESFNDLNETETTK